MNPLLSMCRISALLAMVAAVLAPTSPSGAQEPFRVRDINPNGSSLPQHLAAVAGTLYFTADDGSGIGRELWKSDGTEAGTVLVEDIWPGFTCSCPLQLTGFAGEVYFEADDGSGTSSELWKSDGTEAGTVLVKDIWPGTQSSNIDQLTASGGTLFFQAAGGTDDLGALDVELWKTDGTTAGTVMVKDINPTGGSFPEKLVDVGGTLFFVADDGVAGKELWKSDGTDAGTVLVADLTPGADGSSLQDPVAFAGELYFGFGSELWRSDGTAAGTVMVADVGGPVTFGPSSLVDVGGTLFFVADDGVNGLEPWKSDGSAGGTGLVEDVWPGSNGSGAARLTAVGSILFLKANDSTTGAELFKSDGATVDLVEDINPGVGGSDPRELTDAGGTLYFQALDPDFGSELWVSDGTADGTDIVADIAPGGSSANPSELTVRDGTLFFRARDGDFDEELWALEFAPPGPDLAIGGVCPGPATITLTDLTPESPVGLAASDLLGSFIVPGGACSGTELDLEEPTPLAVLTADSAGELVLDVDLPESACGLAMQALDVGSCLPSNVAFIPLP